MTILQTHQPGHRLNVVHVLALETAGRDRDTSGTVNARAN